MHKVKLNQLQGGHGTGKTGNLAVNFSRQGKHREFNLNLNVATLQLKTGNDCNK